jgi:hypothetical protein
MYRTNGANEEKWTTMNTMGTKGEKRTTDYTDEEGKEE